MTRATYARQDREAVIIQGAEAIMEPGTFLGRPVLRKVRIVKPYRHPVLDARIRDERTRDEANLLLAARRAGVPVPVLYDIDRLAATLTMEPIGGAMLRAVLPDDDAATAADRFTHLGAVVARMHDAGITHGDLTTSNILVPDPADAGSLVLIDFGLGHATRESEPRGVDLHLMEEALEATDDRGESLFAAFLESYEAQAEDAEATLRRLYDIRERGRNRNA